MAELFARAAWAGPDLPVVAGGVTLAAAPEAAMLSVAPFRGQAEAAAGALGVAPPAPGRAVDLADGSRLVWAGLDLWFLRGPAADEGLEGRRAGRAAVTDQTDGWVALRLSGGAAAEALARLAPIDLAQAAFPDGSAARTELRHMACLIERREDGFEILVPRSVAATAIHELVAAIRAVAARARLG